MISAYYNDCHTARIEASSESWKSRHCGSLHRIKGCLAFGFQTQTSQSLIINGSKAANSNTCLWCDSYRLHGNVEVVYRSKKQGTKSRKLEGGRLKDARNFQKFESALVLTWRSPVGIHKGGVSMTVTLFIEALHSPSSNPSFSAWPLHTPNVSTPRDFHRRFPLRGPLASHNCINSW